MSVYDNLVRASWIFDLHGPSAVEDQAEFSLWWGVDPAHIPTDWSGDLTAFAKECYDQWAANADDSIIKTSVTLNSVKATHTNNAGAAQHVETSTGTTPWAGASTAASLPWQVSFCVGLYSYTPGSFIAQARSRRGRCYLPPMTSGVLDIPTKGTMSDARVTNTLTWFAAMVHALELFELPSVSTGMVPGVRSTIHAKVKRSQAELYQITDFAADQVLDTQRRRTHQELKVRHSVPIA